MLSPPGPPYRVSPLFFISFFSDMMGPTRYPLTLTHQIPRGLGASSPTEARQGSSVGKWIPWSGFSFRDIPSSSYWEIHLETELHICYKCARGLSLAFILFAWWLHLCESSQGSRFFSLLVFLWGSNSLRAFNSSFNSSMRVLQFHPMLAVGICICFSQVLGRTYQWIVMLISCLQA
jgi:hypothetical protein